jgi:hypothetical protein
MNFECKPHRVQAWTEHYITATTLVVHDLVNALHTTMKCAALFVDPSNPFDTVDQAILYVFLNRPELCRLFMVSGLC